MNYERGFEAFCVSKEAGKNSFREIVKISKCGAGEITAVKVACFVCISNSMGFSQRTSHDVLLVS